MRNQMKTGEFSDYQVCEGDTVVVYLKNQLEDGAAITLHWHGVHMRGTPFMDGVAMLTQCAVLQFNTFRLENLLYFNKACILFS